jgi:cobalt-zinc-cadmium efflux system protein
MLVDAVGSVGAIVAGLAIVLFGADWVDAAASIFIGVLVVVTAYRLLRDTTHVLLEGAPQDVDAVAVERWLTTAPGVASVHHMHLWHLTSETTALSAHVVLDDQPSLHHAQARGDQLKDGLAEHFDIAHATLELECHDCEPATASGAETRQAQRVQYD